MKDTFGQLCITTNAVYAYTMLRHLLNRNKKSNIFKFHLPTKCLMENNDPEVFPRCDIAHFLTSLQTSLLWTLLETLTQRVWKDTGSHHVIDRIKHGRTVVPI